MGSELLDYNQIQEQSAATGDAIPTTGGLLTWNFRCDPNLALDPSQTWFAMDVEVENMSRVTGNGLGWYKPDICDFRPFFPLRCFSSMTHIIDGVTVAHSNQPYIDKIMQEKFLHENTLSNMSNFEATSTARCIDDTVPEHNLFRTTARRPYLHALEPEEIAAAQLLDSNRSITAPSGVAAQMTSDLQRAPQIRTFLFQPPFDMWTKHQRISGGNHQIQLNLRPATTTASGDVAVNTQWGSYCTTPCQGMTAAFAKKVRQHNGTAGAADTYSLGEVVLEAGPPVVYSDMNVYMHYQRTDAGGWDDADYIANEVCNHYGLIRVNIKRLRLMRRHVRFTIERPLSLQEFNLTEFQFFHGTASTNTQTQNFLLPSSTFGIVFYWRKNTNADYDPVNDYPVLTFTPEDGEDALAATDAGVTVQPSTDRFFLQDFYFTYGGETYPAQRIQNISNVAANQALGVDKMQLISHQLQGVYNMPMDNMNQQMHSRGLMRRLDGQMLFFPVAKHNNADNSDLQVYWKGVSDLAGSDLTVMHNLVVVALYDARVELAYNQANQLQTINRIEWK